MPWARASRLFVLATRRSHSRSVRTRLVGRSTDLAGHVAGRKDRELARSSRRRVHDSARRSRQVIRRLPFLLSLLTTTVAASGCHSPAVNASAGTRSPTIASVALPDLSALEPAAQQQLRDAF